MTSMEREALRILGGALRLPLLGKRWAKRRIMQQPFFGKCPEVELKTIYLRKPSRPPRLAR